MQKDLIDICPITKEKCKILQSHIYPKFIFKYLQSTGGNRFVISRSDDLSHPGRVLQDGFKVQLLGEKAEQMFSKRENWFAQNVFRPYCQHDICGNIKYGTELYYYIISQLWRNFYIQTHKYNIKARSQEIQFLCDSALEEWRTFLKGECSLNNYNQVFLLPLSSGAFTPFKRYYDVELYIKRNIESQIFCSDTGDYVAFCKIPNFVLWCVLSSDCKQQYGFRIYPNGGELNLLSEPIISDEVHDYIWHRIITNIEISNKSAQTLSYAGIDKLNRRMENDKNWMSSEFGEIFSLSRFPQIEQPDEDTIIMHFE